jgi:hypothetical protein
MPANNRLNINETFESQKELITTKIIPALFKVLDPVMYPIDEGVLYEIIHQRHRHQREEMIRKNKAESEQAKESKRRHGNSRRNEVTEHQ